MTALKIDKFGGMLPAWDTRLLPEGQADFSQNCYLFSGALIGWRQPKPLRNLLSSTSKYAYRIPSRETHDTNIVAEDSYWMEFDDPDTTVMHSPVVQDEWNRFYWADSSNVPKYNTYERIVNGHHPWVLGVPASGCTPGVTVTGGGDTVPMGNLEIEAGSEDLTHWVPAQNIFLIPFVPNGSMLIQAINFVPAETNLSARFKGVVYSDLNGAPYERLGIGEQMTGFVVNNTAVAPFSNMVSVIANTTYWLGILHDSSFYLTIANKDLNHGVEFTQTYTNDPPNPAPTVTGDKPAWYMWASMLGASVFEARGYVYTWVTEYGEEGPPSEPVVVNGWSNGIWTIELYQPMPENLGDDYVDPVDGLTKQAIRYITKTRIYRSISNIAGQGTYFFVAEIPVTQATYVDILPDDEVALTDQLTSLFWFAPPEDLQAIVPFPNGIAVGFRKNEIWFSEAYRPHAWPPGYVITTEFPIVGIGVCGQSVVACTQGNPYVASGVNPSTMALTKLNLDEPCLHRGSIVTTDTTVLYISQNGLIQVSQSGAADNMTEGWISRERWQELTPHAQVRAIKHTSAYFAFGGDPIRDGFTIELSSEDKTSFTIWPQAGGHRLGFNKLTSPNEMNIDNVLVDPWTGTGLLLQGGAVYYYDFTDPTPIIVPYKWRSKTYQQLARKNFEAMRVWFTVPLSTPVQVARDVTHPQLELGDNQYGVVRVYVDNELWTTRELRTSGELLRIFSGIKGEQWQFEIEGRVNVSNMQVATSVKELGTI